MNKLTSVPRMRRSLEISRLSGRSKIRIFTILLVLLVLGVLIILHNGGIDLTQNGNSIQHVTDFTIHTYLKIFNASEGTEAEIHSIDVNECVPLNTAYGATPICVYDPKIDVHVSKMIIQFGSWEMDEGNVMISLLAKIPNMQLLDIGCNIGAFALQAAKMGRRVIGIDANKFNLRLLSKSLDLGGLKNNVTLIWNAVSDIHETVTLTIIDGNIGGSFVKSAWNAGPSSKSKTTSITRKALAITLEDLIYFVKGVPLFIKIDIEGSEWKAFRGGERFFKEVDVRFVLMEWMQFKNGVKVREIIEYLTKFGFQPYHVTEDLDLKLNVGRPKRWPENIIWAKK